jgi:NTE family protein
MFGSNGRFWRGDTGGLTAPVRERPESRKRPAPKIGLALGGGAARGWAHIGVLRALNEIGFRPDIVAGTSIGAVVGGCYGAGALDDLEAFARDLTRRRVFGLLDLNFAGSGLIAGNRMTKLLKGRLREQRIEELTPRFVCVATELGTGHEIWMSRGRLVEAMRASYALPGIFQPVNVSGRWLVDGALVNPVPVSAARALGADVVIAVSLNADAFGRGTVVQDHSAEPIAQHALSEMAAGGLATDARKVLRRQLIGGEHGPPGISTVMVEAFNIIQDRISRSRLAGDPPDLLLVPKLSRIGHFEFHRASESIDAGFEACRKMASEIGEIVAALS